MKKRLAAQGVIDESNLPDSFYFTTIKRKKVPVRDAAVDWGQSFKERRLVRTAFLAVPVRERKTKIVFADPFLSGRDLAFILNDCFIKSFDIGVVQKEGGKYIVKTISRDSYTATDDFLNLMSRIPSELANNRDAKISDLPCAKDQIYWVKEMADWLPFEEVTTLSLEMFYPAFFHNNTELLRLGSRNGKISYLPRVGIGYDGWNIECFIESGSLKVDEYVLSFPTNMEGKTLDDYARYFDKLSGLTLRGVSLDTVRIQDILDACPNLKTVEIDCHPSGREVPGVLNAILNKPGIRSVVLTNWKLVDSDQIFSASPSLRSLIMQCSSGTEKGLVTVLAAIAPHIETLELTSEHVNIGIEKGSREAIRAYHFPRLRQLYMERVPLFSIVERAPRLQRLVMSELPPITLPLTTLQNLKYLEFCSNRVDIAFSSEAIRSVIDSCPRLEELSLSFLELNESLDSDGEICNPLRYLRKLSIDVFDEQPSPKFMSSLMKRATQIRALNLDRTHFESVDLAGISYPLLKQVTLSDLSPGANKFAVQLLNGAPALEDCSLTLYCARIGDSDAVTTALPKLRQLKVHVKDVANESFFRTLIDQAPGLESLALSCRDTRMKNCHFSNPLLKLRTLAVVGTFTMTNVVHKGAPDPICGNQRLDIPTVRELTVDPGSLDRMIANHSLYTAAQLSSVNVTINERTGRHRLFGRLNEVLTRVLMVAPHVKHVHLSQQYKAMLYSDQERLPSPVLRGGKPFSIQTWSIGGQITPRSLMNWISVLPSLSSLTIQEGRIKSEGPISRCRHPLKTLIIKDSYIEVEALAEILAFFPYLHELRFEQNRYMNKDFIVLTGAALNKWRQKEFPQLIGVDLNKKCDMQWNIDGRTFKLSFENAGDLEAGIRAGIAQSVPLERELTYYSGQTVPSRSPIESNARNISRGGVPTYFSDPEDQRMSRVHLVELSGDFFDVRKVQLEPKMETKRVEPTDMSRFEKVGTIALKANRPTLLPVPDKTFEKARVVGFSAPVIQGTDEFGQTWVVSETNITLNYAVERSPAYSFIPRKLIAKNGIATDLLSRLVEQRGPLSMRYSEILDYIKNRESGKLCRYFAEFEETEESTEEFLTQNRTHIEQIKLVLRDIKVPQDALEHVATYVLALARKKGSCANRSVLCAWVMREVGVDMVMPSSGVHRWIAIRVLEELVPLDLGGISTADSPRQEAVGDDDAIRNGAGLTDEESTRADSEAKLDAPKVDPHSQLIEEEVEGPRVDEHAKMKTDYMNTLPVWSGRAKGKQLIVFENPVATIHVAAYIRQRTRTPVRVIRSANELKELYPFHGDRSDKVFVVLDINGMSVAEQLDSLEHLEMLREYSPKRYADLRIIIPMDYVSQQEGDCSIQRRLFGSARSKAAVPEELVRDFDAEVKRRFRERQITELGDDAVIVQSPEYGPLPSKGMALNYHKKGSHTMSEVADPVIVTFGRKERERALEKLGVSVLESSVTYSFLDGEGAIHHLMTAVVDERITDVPEDALVLNQDTRSPYLQDYFQEKSKRAAHIHMDGQLSVERGKVVFVDTELSHFDFLKLLRIAAKNGHRILVKNTDMRTTYGLKGELNVPVPEHEQEEEPAPHSGVFVGPRFRSVEPKLSFDKNRVTASLVRQTPPGAQLGRLELPNRVSDGLGDLLRLDPNSHFRYGWEAKDFGGWLKGYGYAVIGASDWEADRERVEMLLSVTRLSAKRQRPFLFGYKGSLYRASSLLRLACSVPQNPSDDLVDRFGSLWASIQKEAKVHRKEIDIELLLSQSQVSLWLPLLAESKKPPHIRLLEAYSHRDQKEWSFTRWVSNWTLKRQSKLRRFGLIKSVMPRQVSSRKVDSTKVHPLFKRSVVLSQSQSALHGQLSALLLQSRQQDSFFKLSCPLLYIEGESGLGKSFISRLALQEQGYQALTGKKSSKARVVCPAVYREITPLHPQFFEHLTEAMDQGYPVVVNEFNIVSPDCVEWLYTRLANRDYARGFCLIATGNTASAFSGRNPLHKGIEAMAMRAGISFNESELDLWLGKMQDAYPELDMKELRENALIAWRKEFLFSTPPPVYIMECITKQVEKV